MDIAQLNHWLDEISYHKQVALGRKARVEDKISTLMGLQLLKRGMRDLGFDDFSLADLKFRPNGKPAGTDGADFSISHAGGLIACAISIGGRIGIDLEPLAAAGPPGTFRNYLNAAELAAARRDPLEGLRIWAAKEAIIKADGDADLRDLADVAVSGQRGRFKDRLWYLYRPQLAAGFIAQVATEQPHLPISIVPTRLL